VTNTKEITFFDFLLFNEYIFIPYIFLFVYIIESNPSIGGRMVQLDKTFPTLDYAMCILGPKLVEIQRHPNIRLLTYFDAKELSSSPGNFKLKYLKKARYVDEDKCTGCGSCVVTCPVTAITIKHFPDKLIESQLESLLKKPDLTERLEADTPPIGAP
jgi:heterodisulfide reductase subunit A-like polyferredoxin